MSWIIRSSTTLTSVPRCLNGARRCDSTKRGFLQLANGGDDRRIETLEMAYLQHTAAG